MNNLFSIFDPQSSSKLCLNWASSLLVLLILPGFFWKSQSNLSFSLNFAIKSLSSDFEAIFGPAAISGVMWFPISMLLFIALNNVMGLAPYIFTSTAHLTFAFSLAIPLWVGHVMYAWFNLPNDMLAHLVPMGTPPALMPFMVLIEMVSNVIRPITLSVRLAANMVAGHLLLTLLSSQAIWLPLPYLLALLAALILLSTLESAVALIQAYVFSVLSALYVSDVNPKSFV